MGTVKQTFNVNYIFVIFAFFVMEILPIVKFEKWF